jgi:hypothetical protein
MAETGVDTENEIEIRGSLNNRQRKICNQLVDIIRDIDGVNVVAMGMDDNMVVTGGKKSHCVWFRVKDGLMEHRIATAINAFRNQEVVIVSNYSFSSDKKDDMYSVPIPPTLNKYMLPYLEIILEE